MILTNKILLATLLPSFLVHSVANAQSFSSITSVTSEFVVKSSAVPVTLTVTPVTTLVDNATEGQSLVVANVIVSAPQSKRRALRLPQIAGVQNVRSAISATIKGSNKSKNFTISLESPKFDIITIV